MIQDPITDNAFSDSLPFTEDTWDNASTNPQAGTSQEIGNMPTEYEVPPTPNTRAHKDHPEDNIIGDTSKGVQTRSMIAKKPSEQAFLSFVYEEKKHGQIIVFLLVFFHR